MNKERAQQKMDIVLGVNGPGFVLLCTDRVAARSINVFKQDEDKILQMDTNKLMAMAGPQGDRAQFGEFIQKILNYMLYVLVLN